MHQPRDKYELTALWQPAIQQLQLALQCVGIFLSGVAALAGCKVVTNTSPHFTLNLPVPPVPEQVPEEKRSGFSASWNGIAVSAT